jgi:hypothetical protein
MHDVGAMQAIRSTFDEDNSIRADCYTACVLSNVCCSILLTSPTYVVVQEYLQPTPAGRKSGEAENRSVQPFPRRDLYSQQVYWSAFVYIGYQLDLMEHDRYHVKITFHITLTKHRALNYLTASFSSSRSATRGTGINTAMVVTASSAVFQMILGGRVGSNQGTLRRQFVMIPAGIPRTCLHRPYALPWTLCEDSRGMPTRGSRGRTLRAENML